MKKQNFKTIIIILTINIASCSVVGELWYERIDQYIANQILEYASFTENQKVFIRKSAADFKNWNTKSELPKYKELLLKFKALDNQTDIGLGWHIINSTRSNNKWHWHDGATGGYSSSIVMNSVSR